MGELLKKDDTDTADDDDGSNVDDDEECNVDVCDRQCRCVEDPALPCKVTCPAFLALLALPGYKEGGMVG